MADPPLLVDGAGDIGNGHDLIVRVRDDDENVCFKALIGLTIIRLVSVLGFGPFSFELGSTTSLTATSRMTDKKIRSSFCC